MTIFIGVGGGSDLSTARVLDLLMKTDNPVFITIFRPVRWNGGMHCMKNTILKYTGLPYKQNGVEQAARAEYKKFVAVRPNRHALYFRHADSYNVFGLLLEDRRENPTLFQFNRDLLSDLYMRDPDKRLITVDTGGDSLRGIVTGMGDRDLSELFDGTIDDRDGDALFLASQVVGGPVTLYVVGPGSDGETTMRGLQAAHEWLDDADQHAASGCRLTHRGRVSAFSSHFKSIDEWSHPNRGSTIWNIVNALDKTPDEQIPIVRRGRELDSVPAKFLQEYWVFDILR